MSEYKIKEMDQNFSFTAFFCTLFLNNEKFVDSSLSAVETRFSVVHSVAEKLNID